MEGIISLQKEIIQDKENLLKLMINQENERINQENEEDEENKELINNLIEITSNENDYVSNIELKALLTSINSEMLLQHLKKYLTELSPGIKKKRNSRGRGLSGLKIV
tara:strand:+ start:380 stop:703 length:324 start_codon:yes stop_codon:yes gene_type:complete